MSYEVKITSAVPSDLRARVIGEMMTQYPAGLLRFAKDSYDDRRGVYPTKEIADRVADVINQNGGVAIVSQVTSSTQLSIPNLLQSVPKLPQRQDSTTDQLRDLYVIANHFGLYDAADVIAKRLLQ